MEELIKPFLSKQLKLEISYIFFTRKTLLVATDDFDQVFDKKLWYWQLIQL